MVDVMVDATLGPSTRSTMDRGVSTDPEESVESIRKDNNGNLSHNAKNTGNRYDPICIDSEEDSSRSVTPSDLDPKVSSPEIGLPNPEPAPQQIKLSPEQESVLAMVQNGKNVFFTGPAGKSRYRFVIPTCHHI
jgi:hypothetical protein